MEILLSFVIGVIFLVAFFVWQHRYSHPDSLRTINERERELLKQATKEIHEAKKRD